jgi:competence protein ComEC
MTDRKTVALALATAVGAWIPLPISPCIPGLVCLIALLCKKQWVFVVACAATASALSAQDWQGLNAPLEPRDSGVAHLVTDPERAGNAYRCVAALNDRHYEFWATGANAQRFKSLEAGQTLHVHGDIRALSGPRAASLRRRHVAGTFTVQSMHVLPSTQLKTTLPNGLRKLLHRGSNSMAPENQALYTGLVYGDDRNLPEKTVTAFRDSGLAHLTAVSGANVAFVLLLLSPVLRRYKLFGRFAGGALVLIVFGALTRWEPSVVRAELMAAIALYAAFVGKPASLTRCLALGVTAAVLLDPFLVGSLGFLFSVAACAGMAAFANAVSVHLPGLPVFRRALAYSAAAQLAIAPLQWFVFGTVPMVGLVTNLLADPVAGLVMIWGVPAGLLAGVVGGQAASLLHTPTTVLLEWVQLVAICGAHAERDPALRWLVFGVPLLALFSWKRRSALVQTEAVAGPG